jgi:exodeoxyribonuclease V alpha subunit
MEAENTLSNMKLDELQTEAITLSCDIKNRIASVTGQAGTGKTTILKQVYKTFEAAGYLVILAAPTGKAAKRISEATGIPAVTLHRLLEFTHPGDPDPKTGKVLGISVPRRTRQLRLDHNVILVDEASMINQELYRDLIDAMPNGGVIRFFGDANQLPPIEERDDYKKMEAPFKKVLKDFPSVTLTNIYRQGEGSGVVKNGHRILHGMVPQQFDDFKLVIGKPHLPNVVLDLAANSGVDFGSLDNQIITPTNKGWIGQVQLNQLIQRQIWGDRLHEAVLMPRPKWDKVDLFIMQGEKVIWKKNDYNLGIFNGETGIVEDMGNDCVSINFGDRVVSVPPWIEYTTPDGGIKGYDPRVNIYLAYALTTHACQGSEYQHVVYVMDRSAWGLLIRGNFYTAITRARRKAWVVSDTAALQRSVINTQSRF